MVPQLIIAAPGGLAVGWLFAQVYFKLKAWLGQTLTARVSEFVVTFGTWVIAEHLHVSPILAIVAFAMTAAHYGPAMQSARDRVHSYAIWELSVFVLNVLAFLLMGLQARTILARLDGTTRWDAILFATTVLLVVVLVRIVWVMTSSLAPRLFRLGRPFASTTPREAVLISWCGMRGLVTLATAFALPAGFPQRDVIVLSAFIVVLGSLVLQGLTVNLLIRWLKLEPDRAGTRGSCRRRTRGVTRPRRRRGRRRTCRIRSDAHGCSESIESPGRHRARPSAARRDLRPA
jgi:CPA1 family monovalent cation:H+ antiporter